MTAAKSFHPPTVTILCSGVALGVYIPGLLVDRRMEFLRVPTDVLLLESFYKSSQREKLRTLKKAYHRNFPIAQLAHRMTSNIQSSLDETEIDNLLDRWQREDRRHFMVWSGFWMPVIDSYRKRMPPGHLAIDVCRIDAVPSATFKEHTCLRDDETEVWFWNWERRCLDQEVHVKQAQPVPFDQRAKRFVIHGGGWGIGTYQEQIPELTEHGFRLDVVAYEAGDLPRHPTGHRYYMINPEWAAWRRGESGRHEFPPFGEVTDSRRTAFRNRHQHHELYDLIADSQAVISKPGGGTLIDSLWSATPIVLLDAYGYAEQKNAELWQELGFGIHYNRWRETNFDGAVLEQLHTNLLNHPRSEKDYATHYVERLLANQHRSASSPPAPG